MLLANHCLLVIRRLADGTKADLPGPFRLANTLAAVTSASASPRFEKCLCMTSYFSTQRWKYQAARVREPALLSSKRCTSSSLIWLKSSYHCETSGNISGSATLTTSSVFILIELQPEAGATGTATTTRVAFRARMATIAARMLHPVATPWSTRVRFFRLGQAPAI
jgi:hypothetical protein